MGPLTIISGAQTGVDRGALIAAAILKHPHGGWCPKGRKAEDGVIPDCYPVTECDSDDYAVRTRKNVEDSDATLVLSYEDEPTGGTRLTTEIAAQLGRALAIITLDPSRKPEWDRLTARFLRGWVEHKRVSVLNVAGPRESKAPGIQDHACEIVLRLLQTRASCLCGRAIPAAVWERPDVRPDSPLKCSACGHITFGSDFLLLTEEQLRAMSQQMSTDDAPGQPGRTSGGGS